MRIHGLLSVLTSCMTAYVTAIYPCRNFVFPVSWCTTRCILVFPVSYVPLDICIFVQPWRVLVQPPTKGPCKATVMLNIFQEKMFIVYFLFIFR